MQPDRKEQSGRVVMLADLRRQIGELDDEIDLLQRQREEVDAAQRVLEQVEAHLRRMAMLAREAAQNPPGARRPGLEEEFEDCKQAVEELSEMATLSGFNLLQDRADTVQMVIDALMAEFG